MQGRARHLASQGSKVLFTSFHEVGYKQRMVLSPVSQPGVFPNKQDTSRVFHVAKLEQVSGEDGAEKRRHWAPAFSEQLCEGALFDTMHESVQLVKSGRRAWKRGRVDLNTVEFNVSPGKMTFVSRGERSKIFQLEPNSEGEISESQVQRFGLRPFFNPFLRSCMVDKVTEALQEEGFVCLNPEKPGQHTIVHLETEEQGERFTVTLAKDESQNGVESKNEESDERRSSLPKVISVKTKKKKISNITLFADKSLDLRASLTVYEEDLGNLTYHVHDVLMAAWEQRDSEGGIEIPKLATGVRVDMVKQVRFSIDQNWFE